MQLIAFGLIAGALWSLIPGAFSCLIHEPEDLLPLAIAGGLTGVAVTCAVVGLFRLFGSGVWTVLGATILSPMLGGSLFGLLIGYTPGFSQELMRATADHHVSFVLMYFYGICWIYLAWLVLPLALLTNLLLRREVMDQAARRLTTSRVGQHA